MALFNLTTIELWEHKVEYYDIEAETPQEAYELVLSGDEAYGDHECVDCGYQTLGLVTVTDDESNEIPFPAELSANAERTDATVESRALSLLRRLVAWQQQMGGWDAPAWREAEALVAAPLAH